MRRRDFITLVGGAAVTPVVARAQQSAPVIGVLASVSPGPYAPMVVAIKAGLAETGYVEGRNLTIEYRWAEGHYDRLAEHANDLVKRQVSAILLIGGGPTPRVAKAATATIPIIFTTGDDPVRSGLVASLNRPGGNITGISLLTVSMEAKRLQLLQELVPNAAVVAVIVNPENPQVDDQVKSLQDAARTIGTKIRVLKASNEGEIDAAFVTLAQAQASALVVGADAYFNTRANQFADLAAQHAVPSIYVFREFATAGGLMSYGPSLVDAYRQAGVYTGRIVRGEKPSDLPVQQVVKVELIVNLKTAKALGINVPLPLLGRADEVIE